MHRVAITLALALCLLGCGSAALPSDRVALVTDGRSEDIGCWLMPTYGELVADPTFGVAFKGTGAPAVWPSGYTGRRVGSEVEVLNRYGKVVATTGVGVQQIFIRGGAGTGPLSGGAICEASRAADHLQPLPTQDSAP